MKTGLIITGGTLNPEFAGLFLRENKYDLVIAVDGGLGILKALGKKPDAIVGDFDTVPPDILEEYKKLPDIMWEQHQAEKDQTDTELALCVASRLGCAAVDLLGATGGRMDHAVGNIHLLYFALKNGMCATIFDEKNKIYILDHGKTFFAAKLWGKYISFLPLTEEVLEITLTGFKYPLFRKDISIGTSLCISNELDGDKGEMTLKSGVLICVESHD